MTTEKTYHDEQQQQQTLSTYPQQAESVQSNEEIRTANPNDYFFSNLSQEDIELYRIGQSDYTEEEFFALTERKANSFDVGQQDKAEQKRIDIARNFLKTYREVPADYTQARHLLFNHMVFWLNGDIQLIETIFKKSCVYRPHGKEEILRNGYKGEMSLLHYEFDKYLLSRDIGRKKSKKVTDINQDFMPCFVNPLDNGKPIPIVDIVDTEEMTLDIFPSKIREFILVYAEKYQVPYEMIACGVLSSVSIACTYANIYSKLEIIGKDKQEVIKKDNEEADNKNAFIQPSNNYFFLGLPSGEMKSACVELVKAPLVEWFNQYRELKLLQNKEISKEYHLVKKEIDVIAKNSAKIENENKNSSIDKIMEALKPNNSRMHDCEESLKNLKLELRKNKTAIMFIDDTTPESLCENLFCNKDRLVVMDSEDSFMEGLNGKYNKNASFNILLKAYDGHTYVITRKSEDIMELLEPLLNIFLATQPETLSTYIKNDKMQAKGLIARFNLVFPKSKVGTRNHFGNESSFIDEQTGEVIDISKENVNKVYQEYNSFIRSILDISCSLQANSETGKPLLDEETGIPVENMKRYVEFSEEAINTFRTFINKLEERLKPGEELDQFQLEAGKMKGKILRFSVLIHVMKYQSEALEHKIEEKTCKFACYLATYFLQHARKFYKETEGELTEEMLKVINWFKDKKDFTSTAVKSRFKKLGINVLNSILNELIAHNYLTYHEEKRTKGMPIKYYRVVQGD